MKQEAGSNKIRKPDGTYLLPSDPGTVIRLEKDDIIETPSGTKIITEPSDDGSGGGEEIIGGSPYVMKNNGNITSPVPVNVGSEGDYPTVLMEHIQSSCILVVLSLTIQVYTMKKVMKLLLTLHMELKLNLEYHQVGSIRSIKVTEPGEGFKEIPKFISNQEG